MTDAPRCYTRKSLVRKGYTFLNKTLTSEPGRSLSLGAAQRACFELQRHPSEVCFFRVEGDTWEVYARPDAANKPYEEIPILSGGRK